MSPRYFNIVRGAQVSRQVHVPLAAVHERLSGGIRVPDARGIIAGIERQRASRDEGNGRPGMAVPAGVSAWRENDLLNNSFPGVGHVNETSWRPSSTLILISTGSRNAARATIAELSTPDPGVAQAALASTVATTVTVRRRDQRVRMMHPAFPVTGPS